MYRLKNIFGIDLYGHIAKNKYNDLRDISSKIDDDATAQHLEGPMSRRAHTNWVGPI